MRSRGRSEIGGEIGAIVRQVAQSTIAIDNRDRQSRCSSIDGRTIAPLVNRRLSLLARRMIAPLVNRQLSLFPLPLFNLGSLFSLFLSLSLSLSGNDLNRK